MNINWFQICILKLNLCNLLYIQCVCVCVYEDEHMEYLYFKKN